LFWFQGCNQFCIRRTQTVHIGYGNWINTKFPLVQVDLVRVVGVEGGEGRVEQVLEEPPRVAAAAAAAAAAVTACLEEPPRVAAAAAAAVVTACLEEPPRVAAAAAARTERRIGIFWKPIWCRGIHSVSCCCAWHSCWMTHSCVEWSCGSRSCGCWSCGCRPCG